MASSSASSSAAAFPTLHHPSLLPSSSRRLPPPLRSSLSDPYSTLGLPLGASPQQVKQARRKLALKFHPDVCKGESCAAEFIQMEHAYKTIMNCLNGRKANDRRECAQEEMMGLHNDSWEDWEEWMGWEGAGSRDYSSHINRAL